MCQFRKGPLPHKVSQIDFRELRTLLDRMRNAGMTNVILDLKPDTSARVVAIKELVDFVDEAIKQVNPYRVKMDEWVRLLEGRRRLGIPTDKEDEYLPIDCGNCGALFTVHEIVYRQWRSGEKPDMLCPNCLRLFREGRFGTVKCSTCGNPSGTMPTSLCERFNRPGSGWRCQDCLVRDAEAELQSIMSRKTKA